jgi:Fungal specific transcription factor domain
MLALSPDPGGHEICGFLLETYAYLVSVVNFTANTDSDYKTVVFDPCTETLESFRDSKVYGALLGCGQDLFELIPSICKFGYRRITEEKNDKISFETIALYKSLESKIRDWQPPEEVSQSSSTKDRIVSAKIYQQALLVFLHANYYGSKVTDPKFLALVDTSLAMSVPLLDNITEDSPIMATLLWPGLILGSCLQQPLHRMLLRHRMLASPFNMLLVSQTVQLLDWLWQDNEFGPYGLGNVMKKHKIKHCMG